MRQVDKQMLYIIYHLFIFVSCCGLFAEPTEEPKDEDGDGSNLCSLPEVVVNGTELDVDSFRTDFAKISEVKFPGFIGLFNEKLVCKIKCIDGNWVGPLCSETEDGRFQPMFRECSVEGDNPSLYITFRNRTFENGARFPHGSKIRARCNHFGLYKLIGEAEIFCENGEWSTNLPQCVPTTSITNFTEDAPPGVIVSVRAGSASVEASGELFVFTDSTLQLHCVAPRVAGDPVWSWTSAQATHQTGWSSEAEHKDTQFTLELQKMSARDAGIYTCGTPRGETHSIYVQVISAHCLVIEENSSHMQVWSEGNKLGQAAQFSCDIGFKLNGSANATCMASGQWSSFIPNCVPIFCPFLKWLSQHLSVVEYNSSYGGRAVFQCSWGYRLVGPPGIECEQHGTWSGQPPTCAAIYCANPILPENGYLVETPGLVREEHYSVGDLVQYSCREPHTIVGLDAGLTTCTAARVVTDPKGVIKSGSYNLIISKTCSFICKGIENIDIQFILLFNAETDIATSRNLQSHAEKS